MEREQTCEQCMNRSICEVRRYFNLGKADEHIKNISKNPDNYAEIRYAILRVLHKNCKVIH